MDTVAEVLKRASGLRNLPGRIDGYGDVRAFTGAFDNLGTFEKAAVRLSVAMPGKSKVLGSIRAAIDACGLKNGGVVSFHHHLRNGDHVMALVVGEIARAGLKDITIAPNSIFPVHAPLVSHFESDVVTGIHTAYMVGPVAEALSRGLLRRPVVMCTHGGRARDIEYAAVGAKLAIVTTRLNAGGYAKVVGRVTTLTTPGETIDVLVTEAGVAVNPQHEELRARLVDGNDPVVPIEALKERARRGASNPLRQGGDGRPIAVVEYRDGTVIDVVSAVA